MKGQQKISSPKFMVGRERVAQATKHRSRFLLVAVVLSFVVHIAVALLVVLLPRILPNEAQPQAQGTVELLMVEQKGTNPSEADSPKAAPTKHQDQADLPINEDKREDKVAQPSETTPSPAVLEHNGEPLSPLPKQAEPAAADASPPPRKQVEAKPAEPTPREAPVFDLGGTESESNATALGNHILPAMRDDRFRNRPPVYPVEAEIHGEHGSVVVVIHVSANGLATGADVLESSGYKVLDQAALTAVEKWRFHAAIKEGRSVPFDMPFRFIFEPY